MTPDARQPDADTVTSTTLLRRVGAVGDDAACATFVRHYGPMVRAIAAASGVGDDELDDVEQEAMAAAVGALRANRYDRRQGRFKRFFKGVIRHKVRDALAARRRHQRLGSAEPAGGCAARPPASAAAVTRVPFRQVADPRPSPAEAFEAAFDAEWQKAATEEALDQLRREVEATTFQAFDLYVRKDMPPSEVAGLLGISRYAVYIAKTRVLARLREILGPEAQ